MLYSYCHIEVWEGSVRERWEAGVVVAVVVAHMGSYTDTAKLVGKGMLRGGEYRETEVRMLHRLKNVLENSELVA